MRQKALTGEAKSRTDTVAAATVLSLENDILEDLPHELTFELKVGEKGIVDWYVRRKKSMFKKVDLTSQARCDEETSGECSVAW